MAFGAVYRMKAAELLDMARDETHKEIRAQLERLAEQYQRLAEQADRNQTLQQQQPQAEPRAE